MMKNSLFAILALCLSSLAQSQTKTAGAGSQYDGINHILIAGDGEVTYFRDQDNSSFTELNFKPIFLWHISDKLFVESEVEIETGEGEASLGLEYLNMCYFVNPYLTLHAGRFLPKFGAYRGRMAEGFLNRLPTDPIGFGDGGIGASIETGIGVLGGLPIGNGRLNYDFYLSNGPHLLTDSANAGQFDYEAYIGNNKSVATGGRIGILPISDQSLEIGYSFLAKKNTSDQAAVDHASVFMQAVDFNFYHVITQIRGTIRVMGEWRHQKVGNVTYYKGVDDLGNPIDPYNLSGNSPTCYYVLGSLRLSQLSNLILRNFEIAFRYSHYQRPSDAPWAEGLGETNRTTVGIDYWLHWNSLLKLAYQVEKNTPHGYYAQLVFGF